MLILCLEPMREKNSIFFPNSKKNVYMDLYMHTKRICLIFPLSPPPLYKPFPIFHRIALKIISNITSLFIYMYVCALNLQSKIFCIILTTYKPDLFESEHYQDPTMFKSKRIIHG